MRRNSYGSLFGSSSVMNNLYDKLESIKKSSGHIVIKAPIGTEVDQVCETIHSNGMWKDRPIHYFQLEEDFDDYIDCFDTLVFNVSKSSPDNIQKLIRFLKKNNSLMSILMIVEDKVSKEISDILSRYISITIPEISMRKSDIPILIDHYIGDRYIVMDESALLLLIKHKWIGNTKEIKDFVLYIEETFPKKNVISHSDISSYLTEEINEPPITFNISKLLNWKTAKEEFNKEYLKFAIKFCDGNKAMASRLTGIDRKYLYAKIKELGIEEL